MKYVAVFAVLAYFATTSGIIISKPSVVICPVMCNPGNSTNVCGKAGGVCIRFANACRLGIYKCKINKAMTKVALSRCRGIPVGRIGTCQAATGNNTSGVTVINTNNLGGSGSIGGLFPSTSSVTPIIIRV